MAGGGEAVKTKERVKERSVTCRRAWQTVSVMFEPRTGICLAIQQLYTAGLISRAIYNRMNVELQAHRPPRAMAYWWTLDDEGNKARAEFAAKRAKAKR